jgi:hypothetical protein
LLSLFWVGEDQKIPHFSRNVASIDSKVPSEFYWFLECHFGVKSINYIDEESHLVIVVYLQTDFC